MARNGSTHLHQLIQSMTKAEKRYFKLQTASFAHKGENAYSLLFNFIEKQVVYDEAAVLKKFKGKQFAKQFATTKRRLYEHVMKCLRSFHSVSSIDTRLRAYLQNAELLHQKALYKQSAKALKQAKKLAEKHERWTILVEISNWEKKLIEKDNYAGQDKDSIEAILLADKRVSQTIGNYFEYWGLKSRFFSLMYKQGQARTQEEKDRYKAILEHPLMQEEDLAVSTDSKYLYHHIYSAYYFSVNDFENCYYHLAQNASIIEKNPAVFEEEPNAYFGVLTNVIFVGNQLKKYQEIEEYLEKLYALVEGLKGTKSTDLKMKLFGSISSLELHMYVQRAEFDKAYALIPKICVGIQEYDSKLSPIRKADFYYSMSVVCLALQKYSEANQHINQLLNTKGLDESEDMYAFAQLINILIHYELGHMDLLPYIAKSSYRCLRKKGRYYQTERAVLSGYKSMATHPNKEQAILQKLLSEIVDLNETVALQHFDFESYIRSKLEQRSFAEVLKKKE